MLNFKDLKKFSELPPIFNHDLVSKIELGLNTYVTQTGVVKNEFEGA